MVAFQFTAHNTRMPGGQNPAPNCRSTEGPGLSADWRFGIAYNAALKLCTILMYTAGFRPEKNLAHYRTLQALPLILGAERSEDADYLDACRNKRNTVEYDYIGGVTDSDANELFDFTKQLKSDVMKWLMKTHPELIQ